MEFSCGKPSQNTPEIGSKSEIDAFKKKTAEYKEGQTR